MKYEKPTQEYLAKAMSLSRDEAEQIFSRMRRRLTREMDEHHMAPLNAVALQLQFEDEQLADWRQNLAKLRKRDKKE